MTCARTSRRQPEPSHEDRPEALRTDSGHDHSPPAPQLQQPDAGARMANPASEYCLSQGGRLEIVRDASGREKGMCHLPDGTVIDEWALYRRDHAQE